MSTATRRAVSRSVMVRANPPRSRSDDVSRPMAVTRSRPPDASAPSTTAESVRTRSAPIPSSESIVTAAVTRGAVGTASARSEPKSNPNVTPAARMSPPPNATFAERRGHVPAKVPDALSRPRSVSSAIARTEAARLESYGASMAARGPRCGVIAAIESGRHPQRRSLDVVLSSASSPEASNTLPSPSRRAESTRIESPRCSTRRPSASAGRSGDASWRRSAERSSRSSAPCVSVPSAVTVPETTARGTATALRSAISSPLANSSAPICHVSGAPDGDGRTVPRTIRCSRPARSARANRCNNAPSARRPRPVGVESSDACTGAASRPETGSCATTPSNRHSAVSTSATSATFTAPNTDPRTERVESSRRSASSESASICTRTSGARRVVRETRPSVRSCDRCPASSVHASSTSLHDARQRSSASDASSTRPRSERTPSRARGITESSVGSSATRSDRSGVTSAVNSRTSTESTPVATPRRTPPARRARIVAAAAPRGRQPSVSVSKCSARDVPALIPTHRPCSAPSAAAGQTSSVRRRSSGVASGAKSSATSRSRRSTGSTTRVMRPDMRDAPVVAAKGSSVTANTAASSSVRSRTRPLAAPSSGRTGHVHWTSRSASESVVSATS